MNASFGCYVGRISNCLAARGKNVLLNHHRRISIPTACFSSSSPPHLKTQTVKASSSLSTSAHSVVKLTSCGDVSLQCMTTSDILKGTSAMLARDLFSLSLNTHACPANPSDDTFGMKHPPPVILPRKQEVLISFGSTRALVKKDMALIFDGQKPSTQLFAGEMASYFEEKTRDMLEAKRTSGDNFEIIYPDDFEIVFIEEVLRGTCDSFYRRLRIYEPIIGNLMSKVDEEVFSTSGVQHLVPLKDSLQEFEMLVSQCLECLENMEKNDNDMLGLLLTKQSEAHKSGVELGHDMHEEIELMLEAYIGQLSAIRREIRYLIKRIESKTAYLSITLDSYRNRMITMDVYLGIVGVGLGVSTTVAGFVGMNMLNGYEESSVAFFNTVAATSLVSLLTVFGCTRYLSGKRLKQAARHRAVEIESIEAALADMTAVDYAVKTMLRNENTGMDKHEFAKQIAYAKGKPFVDIKDKGEVNKLFELLDATKDGIIDKDDFQCMQSFSGQREASLSPKNID